MSEKPAEDGALRRGPRSQIALLERSLRRQRLLADDDRIVEWRQGWIIRWRADGLEQSIPGFGGMQRVPGLRGMSSVSYSSRSLFFYVGRTTLAADLTRVRRLESIGRRSLCVIFSPAPSGIISVQWKSGDYDEDMAALVARILDRRDGRLSELPLKQREQISRELADLAAFGVAEAEFGQISAPPGAGPAVLDDVPTGPVTVTGRWMRAAIAGDTAERRRLQAQLNGGRAGWNDDEPKVRAACELAVRQHWGGSHDLREVSDAVSFMREMDQTHGKTPHSQAEMETVIRSALGDTSADTTGITPPAAFEIQSAVTGYLALKLAWPPQLIDALLAEAERITFEQG